MTSSNNRNSLSQFYEKSLKKVSGVYIQTKQNSIKFLSTLNINIANKVNEHTEREVEQKINENYDKETKYVDSKQTFFYDKETKYVDSKPAFFNPLTPYQIESYHNFITDTYNSDDDNAYLTNSPLYKNSLTFPLYSPSTRSTYLQSPTSINEKDLSDQESLDDQDDYFSRKKSNYSSQSSSSSVSTSGGFNELALTPLSNDKSDEGYEIINEEEVVHIGQEKPKVNILKRRKSNMKSNQKSDKNIKLRNKLSLKLNKNKSSSTATDKIGTVNFEEFISSLDISEDTEDRLQWLFRFYDNDDDGFITRDEMLQIMHTLYN